MLRCEYMITENLLTLSPLLNYAKFISCHLCCVSPEEQPDLPEKPYEMATCVFTPTSGLSTTLRDILTDRPAVSKYHNFLRGFQMHNEYIQNEHFTKWKGVDGSPAYKPHWGRHRVWELARDVCMSWRELSGFCGYLLVLTERRENEGTSHTFHFQ